MDQKKKLLAVSLLATASLSLATSARAVTYTELLDAGQTLATATNTLGTTGSGAAALTGINGTISSPTDADLYMLTISNPTTVLFAATSTAGIDTSLFVFNSTGAAVVANDDVVGNTLNPVIPAGTSFLLTAGTYYVGISLSGNEPVNSNNQSLFTADQPTTLIRGAAAGLNPATEATFNGLDFFDETGAYSISFVQVPEPSTYATLALGAAAGAVSLRRLRRRQTV